VSVAVAANPAPESLLVVRLGAMGDIIHTLPAVTTLRAELPDARIGWVVEERWAELLCAKNAPRSGSQSPARPLVDFVHSVDTKRWRKSLLSYPTWSEITAALRQVRSQQYDVAVDFQGALKSAVLTRCAGAGTIFGMERPRELPARFFYKRRVLATGVHVVEQYQSLAEAVITEFSSLRMRWGITGKGTAPSRADTDFPDLSGTAKSRALPGSFSSALNREITVEFPHDDEAEANIAKTLARTGKDFVLITPGAGWASKQWPPERYGEVSRALANDGLAPLINFGPGEEKLALEVEAASGSAAEPISCSIAEFIALTRRARLFIGGDTGPLHLAAALHVPVVAIFGPTDPARNGPYGTRSIVLRNPESRTSLSHTRAPDPGLLKITANDVVSTARRLLESAHV
jgi:heptosyltransferase-1